MSTSTSTNILLAIDIIPGEPSWHARAAAEAARNLVRDSADHVMILHVREFSVTRLRRMMGDDGGADGKKVVDEVAASLRASGINAGGQIVEADIGHVADVILQTARQFKARVIVVGSARGRTSRLRLPLGSVTSHLLTISTIPVLVVPQLSHPERRKETGDTRTGASRQERPAGGTVGQGARQALAGGVAGAIRTPVMTSI